jgi:hypothetical protein
MTDAADFPVGRCVPCGRDVLTHVHLDATGRERRLCLHCDAELDPAELRWIVAEDLDALGYAVDEPPAGGCGRPGCGQGRCGNGRGL